MFTKRFPVAGYPECGDDFAGKRQCELTCLAMRDLWPFPVPQRWLGESGFKKYYEKSEQLTPNQLRKIVSDERKNLALALGGVSECVVFRVYNDGKRAFKELRSRGFLCSKDTYAVETFRFVDYYYRIGHLRFVIPTCRQFCGPYIDLLAENSFILTAGSFDFSEFGFEEDENYSDKYEMVNNKEVMLLPKILEDAIVEKFNLSPKGFEPRSGRHCGF